VAAVRFMCDSDHAAASAVLTVLHYARSHKDKHFTFGPLDADGVVSHGLVLDGDVGELSGLLARLPGVVQEAPA